MSDNPLFLTDSYKPTQWPQYPEGMEYCESYWESRGGEFEETVALGMRGMFETYLLPKITTEHVEEAYELYATHFNDDGIFNRKGWLRLVEKHGGTLPLEIWGVREGTPVPTRNALLRAVNTDPEFGWLTNYYETLLSQLWYPSTVATLSRAIKQLITDYAIETGDPLGVPFKLHDFGCRGASSMESAAIGGFAHLSNGLGTDNVPALVYCRKHYDERCAGYSIPASEHSTITSWGRTREADAYRNMIKRFGNAKSGLYACVSDSYNIFDACEKLWGGELREEVLGAANTLVVRPDSGTPHKVVVQVLETLGRKFGFTINAKGYRVLNKVRVIQGDGINYAEIERILRAMKVRRWSVDNVAFGMGGALLQRVDRDTQRFAFKCSAARINGEWVDVFKDPIEGDKRSKAGRLDLVKDELGVYETVRRTPATIQRSEHVLHFRNGTLYERPTLAEIRERAALPEPEWASQAA